MLRRYDGYTFAPRLRAFKTGCSGGYLAGIRERLRERGLWNPEIESQITERISANPRLHIALRACRVARPDWLAACDAESGVGDLVRVPVSDPTYGGWVRLGILEQSFFRSDDRDWLNPDRLARRSAAIVAAELDGVIPPGVTPLPEGDIDEWWQIERDPSYALSESLSRQLVQVGGVNDYLGRNVALIPPVALLSRAQPT